MDDTTLTPQRLKALGLRRHPFATPPKDDERYSDAALDMVINVIVEHLKDASPPILLKGEHGIGKTTQLGRLMDKAQDTLHPCYIEAGVETSMAAIDYALRLQWQPSPRHGEPKQLKLVPYLIALCEDGVRPVLIIDEAQHLEAKVLAQVLELKRVLEADYGQTLGLVLAGEPAIEKTLNRLESKIKIVSRLYTVGARPLNREQTRAYLTRRLSAAGAKDGSLLDDTAMETLFKESGGLPGALNAAATRRLAHSGSGSGTPGDNGPGAGRWVLPGTIGLIVAGILLSIWGLIAGLLSGEEERRGIVEPKPMEKDSPRLPPATQTGAEVRPAITTPTETSPAPITQPEETPFADTALIDEPPESAPQALDESAQTESSQTESSQTTPVVQTEPEPAAEPPVTTVEPPVEETKETPTAEVEAVRTTQDTPPETPADIPPPKPPPEQSERAAAMGLQTHAWLLRQDPAHYAIQVLGVSSEAALKSFYRAHPLPIETAYFVSRRGADNWYVLLVGLYPSAEAARAGIKELPPTLQANNPWIRRLGDVQAQIRSNP